jgi:signal transduction histidine kinase
MKWKILLRYLAILILSVILVFFINSYLLFKFPDQGLGSTASNFTLDFEQYIFTEGGQPALSQEGIQALKDKQAWIQILDEEGYEVYSWNKPGDAPAHYAPSDMVFYNIYTGAIEGYTTFCGTAETNGSKWSYIIGFPMQRVAKYNYVYSPEALKSYLLVMLVTFLVVPTLVFIAMGYIFGRSLADPVLEIIAGIQQLARGEYERRWPEKGLYHEVYGSLNNLAATLKKSEIERQNTERMREEWIQNLSHDLKTPLASIKGYGELLADERYQLTEQELKDYAGIIKGKAQYMEGLLEDLKLTQVLKGGLFPLKREKEDLAALLRDVVIDVLNNPHYEERKIFFTAQQEPIVFPCDRSLLQRAFTNLIYNAVVHNPADTEIHVSIEKTEKIYVRIQDNGRGISQEELANLFERYYRGTSTEENQQGSGLGMAIAKQIIEIHGGIIIVESTIGVGTLVTVLF